MKENNKIFFVSQNEENDSTEEADNEIQNYSDEVENEPEMEDNEEMEELEEEYSPSTENKKRTRQKNQGQSNNVTNVVPNNNVAPKRGRPRKKTNATIYQESNYSNPSNFNANKSTFNQKNMPPQNMPQHHPTQNSREQHTTQQYIPVQHHLTHHKYPPQIYPSNNSQYNYSHLNNHYSSKSTNPNHQQIYSSYPFQNPSKYSRSTVTQYPQTNSQNSGYPVSHTYSTNPSPYNATNYRKEKYMKASYSSQQEYAKDNTSIKFSHYNQIYQQNDKNPYGKVIDQIEDDSEYVPLKTTVHQINSAPTSSMPINVEVKELSSGVDRYGKTDFERSSSNDMHTIKHKKQLTYSPPMDSPNKQSPHENYITPPKQSAPIFEPRFNQSNAPFSSSSLPKISDKIATSKNSPFQPNNLHLSHQPPNQSNPITLPPIVLDSSHYQSSTKLPPIQKNVDKSVSIKSSPSFPLPNKNSFV